MRGCVKTKRIGAVVLVALLLSLIRMASAHAQVQGSEWSEPYRLSSEAGVASAGYCAADQYGYVHCFWTETLYEDQRTIIQYARFDGETWSTPNAIYVTGAGIENVSPVVDKHGTLHIAWAEGLTGPAYYSHAPAYNALSARSWAPPSRIDVPGRTLRLRVDRHGALHLVYIRQLDDPGVFYIRSEDGGLSWTEPLWLDPDILANHVPDGLNFELDDAGGLHAVWFYGALDERGQPDWVRYTHSLNGGETWSSPFLIDHAVEEVEYNLAAPGPIMVVQGTRVHVIWGAGAQSYRHHRVSIDAGKTWSPPRDIFGELNGQAGDGMAIDGAGRLHYFAQIRYPQGIYHAYWDQGRWTLPSLIYLILEGSSPDEVMGDRIHAHDTFPVVRAGNQLVLTFGDGHADPNRRLFAMTRTLDDLAPLELVPTPLPTTGPRLSPTVTPTVPVLPSPVPTALNAFARTLETGPGANLTLRAAMVPTLMLLMGTVGIRLLNKIRRR
jgi:hypothetical protein